MNDHLRPVPHITNTACKVMHRIKYSDTYLSTRYSATTVIVLFVMASSAAYTFYKVFFIGGSYSTRLWIAAVGFPFMLIAACAIPLLRFELTDAGIRSVWSLSIGSKEVWKRERSMLLWKDVKSVYPILPYLPPRMLVVGDGSSSKHGAYIFGSVVYRADEVMLFVADHVSSGVVSEEAKKLIEESRERMS